MSATQDNFKFTVIGDRKVPFEGYVSTDDPTNTAKTVLVRGSQNTYKDLSQQIVNRCGMKRRGAGDNTENGIITDFIWYDSTARTIPVRVLADGKLQFESDVVTPGTFLWYTLGTYADHTRFIFSPWWNDGEQKDWLTMVNGSPDIIAWSGGITTIASVGSFTGAATTIDPVGTGSGISVGTIWEVVGGGGTGCTFSVDSVDGSGAVLTYTLLTAGSGYSVGSGYACNLISSGTVGTNATCDVDATTNGYSITKAGTTSWFEVGFSTSGTIVADGVEYSYSELLNADSTTTLRFTSDTSGLTIGAIVYQSLVTTSNAIGAQYNIDFSIVNNNQLIIGSYASRIAYASWQESYTDFTPTGSMEANLVGNPFILTLDDTLKGFAIRNGNLQVSAGLSDWYDIVIDKVQIPNSDAAVYLQAINVNKKPGAVLSAALGQEFITNVGDDVYYVAQDHQIYIYGSFTNQFSTRFPALSQAIRDELSQEDFTGGSLRSINDTLNLTSITSGKTYTYSARQFVDATGNIVAERLWYPPQVWNISRMSVIDGVIFGASSQNPQYYQLFDTGQFHDDTPTDEVAPYECVARWAYWNFDDRTILGDLSKLYVEGYIAENSDLLARMRLNYLASTDFQEDTISSIDVNPYLFTDAGCVPIGAGIGDHSIGGEGLDEFGNPQLPKFRSITTYKRKNVFEYQFELYSFVLDSQWRVLAIGTNASPVLPKPMFLQPSSTS